jgi:hypothetical protein
MGQIKLTLFVSIAVLYICDLLISKKLHIYMSSDKHGGGCLNTQHSIGKQYIVQLIIL